MKNNAEILFSRLYDMGSRGDTLLVTTLVNISAALKGAINKYPLQRRDLQEYLDKVDIAIDKCLRDLHDATDVAIILHELDATEQDESECVKRALPFISGPLVTCVKYGLTKLLGAPQILTHVRNVFMTSLKSVHVGVVRDFCDLFRLRSGCASLRYCPAFMFSFEGK